MGEGSPNTSLHTLRPEVHSQSHLHNLALNCLGKAEQSVQLVCNLVMKILFRLKTGVINLRILEL